MHVFAHACDDCRVEWFTAHSCAQVGDLGFLWSTRSGSGFSEVFKDLKNLPRLLVRFFCAIHSIAVCCFS